MWEKRLELYILMELSFISSQNLTWSRSVDWQNWKTTVKVGNYCQHFKLLCMQTFHFISFFKLIFWNGNGWKLIQPGWDISFGSINIFFSEAKTWSGRKLGKSIGQLYNVILCLKALLMYKYMRYFWKYCKTGWFIILAC